MKKRYIATVTMRAVGKRGGAVRWGEDFRTAIFGPDWFESGTDNPENIALARAVRDMSNLTPGYSYVTHAIVEVDDHGYRI